MMGGHPRTRAEGSRL